MTSKIPQTRNPEAAVLIKRAQSKCDGCRIAWKMKDQYHTNGGWTMLCKAQSERQELRDIAAKAQQSRKTGAAMNLKNQPPVLVPSQYWSELEKLSKAALMDIAWEQAARAHGMQDDLQGAMIELRASIECVLTTREKCSEAK
jgi:hypothetical protein